METPKELQKKYSYSQADFLELARLINKCFKVDQADFVTFDPTMDATFLAGFDALISEAELMSTDEQIRDEQALRTSEVEEVMRQCRNTSQAFKHFIEQTFPKKPQIWNIFGYNDYEKARKSQAKMIVFMRTLFNVAKNYQQELLAAGTPQGQIDSLKVAGDSLIKVNDDQEFLKKQRLIKTHARIQKYNELWEIVITVCRVGKIVYYDNYSKYKQYLLYQGAGNGSDILTGPVPANRTIVILDENITSETNFKLHNIGNTLLKFCLEDGQNPCSNGVQLSPDSEQIINAADLGSGTTLKCTNNSDTESGEYEVEVS